MIPTSELPKLFVQQSAEFAVLLIDPEGIVLSCSSSANRVGGFEGATLIGHHLTEAYPPTERETISQELQKCASTGNVLSTRELQVGERTIYVEEATTALRGPDGTLAGFGRVLRDISQQRQLEKSIAKANEELHQFAFTVSHDLQEPLRTVRSYSELILRRYGTKIDADANDFLNFIVDGTARMTQLLKDLLAYSQAGRPDRTRREFISSETVLQWAIMNCSKSISESGARITFAEMPPLYADQAQLALVFEQLISNSIKYRGTGAPEIHVSAKAISDEMWEFSFRDNGPGLDPQYTERVFGVFKRLVGKDVPGTGIGLSICRKIVEAHGGRIWMESEPGKGATVKFTLPAND